MKSDFYGFLRSRAFVKAAACMLIASGGIDTAMSVYADTPGVKEMMQQN